MNWRSFPPSVVVEMRADVRLIAAPFVPAAEMAAFAAAHPQAGGIASFIGQVRTDEDVEALELQHYAPLTEPGMATLAEAALARWPLDGLLMIHRTGVMQPGEPIVLVAAAARHRRDAFAAAEFAMDHLKSESWFWKRELSGGQWRWIEPRAEDRADLARWDLPKP
ncbi:MAG TPA: molybdenum cofactor biosynthesis protein MoaE [Novosphingobium sp.]|nr:molybdenum cofactor biosynthesis protein MoaE [Novosphingobium sp.]